MGVVETINEATVFLKKSLDSVMCFMFCLTVNAFHIIFTKSLLNNIWSHICALVLFECKQMFTTNLLYIFEMPAIQFKETRYQY